jgi:hypothetical protein
VVRRTNADRNEVALTSLQLVPLRSAPGFVGLTEPRRTRTDVNIQIGRAAIAEHVDLVDGSFFSTIALPSHRGRYIAATDVDAQSPVGVISQDSLSGISPAPIQQSGKWCWCAGGRSP